MSILIFLRNDIPCLQRLPLACWTIERISVLAAGTIFLVARVWDAISVATDPLVSQFTSQSTGYLWASILFSGVAWILFLLCFKMTAIVKKHKSPINTKIRFKDIGKIIIGNRQLLIVTMVSLIENIAVFIRESASIHYGTWNMGNKALLPFFINIKKHLEAGEVRDNG